MKPDIPTLEDVAKEAGVSTATVSRCMNAPDQVSKNTREKVMKIIKKLGYTPNFGAQALAAKRTNTFGAIVPTMSNAIFAAGLQAFQEELGKQGATLLLASSGYDLEVEEKQIRSLVSRGADGLLLIGTQRSREIYRLLEDRRIPFVIAWNYKKHPTRSCVGFDNVAASYNLAKRALDLGHTKFAIISAPLEHNDRAEGRVIGIKKALEEESIDTGNLQIIESNYSIENGAESFEALMKSKSRPTIIMCGNDVLAAGAVKMAHKMGLSVPGDISITGFDDIELASVIEPSLATVHVPHKTMGRVAAEILLKKMENPEYHSNLKLDTRIIQGQSLEMPAKVE